MSLNMQTQNYTALETKMSQVPVSPCSTMMTPLPQDGHPAGFPFKGNMGGDNGEIPNMGDNGEVPIQNGGVYNNGGPEISKPEVNGGKQEMNGSRPEVASKEALLDCVDVDDNQSELDSSCGPHIEEASV